MKKKEFLEFVARIYGNDLSQLKAALPPKRLEFEMRDDLITERTLEVMIEEWRRLSERLSTGIEEFRKWQKNKDFSQEFSQDYRVYLDDWDGRYGGVEGYPAYDEIMPLFNRLASVRKNKYFPLHEGRLTVRVRPFLAYWQEKQRRAQEYTKKTIK